MASPAVDCLAEAIAELTDAGQTQQKVFAIAEEAHLKKEIKPSEYYQALLTRQTAASALSARRHEYTIKVIELVRFARYGFPFSERIPGLDKLMADSTTAGKSKKRAKFLP